MASHPISRALDPILNIGIEEIDPVQTRRLYRQVNGLNLFYAFVAASVALFSFTILGGSLAMRIMGVVQVVATALYGANLYLNRRRLLGVTRRLTIYVFEWHLFLIVILTQAWDSPVIMVAVLYPLLASLVERSIFRHLLLGLVQMSLLYVLHYFFPLVHERIESYTGMQEPAREVLKIMCLVYFPLMAAFIMNIVFSQNVWARESQKKLTDVIVAKDLQIQKDFHMAGIIQRGFLPPMEKTWRCAPPGDCAISILSHYAPMGKVGGDFFDFIETPAGLFIHLSDVSGHGLPAALISSVIKISFGTAASAHRRPSEVLESVNREYMKTVTTDEYFTSFLILIAPDESGTLMRYSCAGHPPGYLFRSNPEKLFKLDTPGRFIGIDADARYEEKSARLQSGDRILLVTDGILEGRNLDGIPFGADSLCESIRTHHALNAEQFRSALVMDHARHTAGMAQGDDITFLVIDFEST